jgi:hypothetical protein
MKEAQSDVRLQSNIMDYFVIKKTRGFRLHRSIIAGVGKWMLDILKFDRFADCNQILRRSASEPSSAYRSSMRKSVKPAFLSEGRERLDNRGSSENIRYRQDVMNG